jgi:hypothetical protein
MASQSVVDQRGRGVAAVWDEVEAQHLRRAIVAAPLHDEPSPYLFAEHVFSPAAYASILDMFPADDAFRRWNVPADGLARHANYDQRRQIDFPQEAGRLPAAQREFWSALTSLLCGPDFARTLLDLFSAFSRAMFGAQYHDPSFAQEHVLSTMTLFEHGAEYYLGPHTDRREKIFTALFYFAEREGLDHLGTTIYRPLERGFTCDESAHYDPARFERVETMPYRPNSAFIFARTNVLFHGVHTLTAEQLAGSRRRGIQLSLWLRNDRPRSACKTSVEAEFPATLPAGGETSFPYRLTNEADSELASSFPRTIKVGYRWIGADGGTADVGAGPLPSPLAAGESLQARLRVVAPAVAGRYLLRVSPLQDDVAWFDDVDPRNGRAEFVQVWDDARATATSDIVAKSDEIALGAGWQPVEREGERAFRWVENDAVIHVAALRPMHRTLCVLLEPGPGVGSEALALSAHLADGRDLGTVSVPSRQLVRYALPPQVPAVHSVVLHANNGGRIAAGDPRVLNFRVRDVFVERFADVFPVWARPACGFYPAERCEGDVFRWVCGEATVELASARGQTLRFGVEPGPGMNSMPFVLHIVSGAREILRAVIAERTTVEVPLGGLNDATTLQLQADGGGRLVVGDPRALDFRVFAAHD